MICEDTDVAGDRCRRRVIKAVGTSQGRIECSVVVCCAGQWTRTLAATVGVNVPLISVQHQYVITTPFDPPVPRDLPTLRDPDRLTYYKEEVGGLVMGGYEPNPIPWANDGIPRDFNFKLLDADFDHFAPTMELAMGRVPALQTAGINELINGPESFTPDGNFILGEAPELKNFFIGAGFNAFGIAAGGGAGMALAEWVHRGVAPYDLWVATSVASAGPTRTPTGSAREHWRPTASTTRWRGRTRSTTAAGRAGVRRCTRNYSRQGLASARSSAGSVPTGSHRPTSAKPRTTCTATSDRTGSMPSVASIVPRANRVSWSTRRRSPSSR
jgi:hypothetical protein